MRQVTAHPSPTDGSNCLQPVHVKVVEEATWETRLSIIYDFDNLTRVPCHKHRTYFFSCCPEDHFRSKIEGPS